MGPLYPALSFPEAISAAEKIYNQAQLHKTDKASLGQILGYKGLNGRSLAILGSLNAHDLLEGTLESTGLTKDAETILVDPKFSADRIEAIKRCALAPAVYQQVSDNFGGKLPGDQLLRAYLLKAGFSQNAVNKLIDNIKSTFEYIKDIDIKGESDENTPLDSEGEIKEGDFEMNITSSGEARQVPAVAHVIPSNEKELFSYEFEPSGSIRLMMAGDVDTEEALDVLEDLVAMKKKELARKRRRDDDTED